MARTTVRLHPRQGNADLSASKIGGDILWPESEQWPTCAEHGCPYVPAIQLRKDDVPEIGFRRNTNLFQVLWCPNRHPDYFCPIVKVFWRNSDRIKKPLPHCPEPTTAERRYVPTPCVVHPERVVEYPDGGELSERDHELIELSDTINNAVSDLGVEPIGNWSVPNGVGTYYAWLSVAPGTKVGGHPGWVQDPPQLRCTCNHPMEYLVSFSSHEFDGASWGRWLPLSERYVLSAEYHKLAQVQCPAGWSFGDAGSLYLFICRQCDDWPIHAFTQSC